MPPVISALSYAVTESTIVATWTTDIAADSNLSAGGKAAIDNGVAASSTSHQAVVTGLSPSTAYSCFVTSGGVSSSPQNVSTSAAPTRTQIRSATVGAANITTGKGDTFYNAVSDDGITYVQSNDSQGIQGSSGGGVSNIRIDKFTDETLFSGSLVNGMGSYLGTNNFNGTDGPGGVSLTNKSGGMFAMAGKLFLFQYRQQYNGNAGVNAFYQNIIRSDDHGASWNNFSAPSTFNSTGNPVYPPSPAPYMFADSTVGYCSPVMYGVDDGTLGYNVAGNGIDGANAFVYMVFMFTAHVNGGSCYLARMPRIRLLTQDYSATQFWKGPASPSAADFVNDSNWQTGSTAGLTAIYSDAGGVTGGGAGQVSRPQVYFVPAMNYYVLMTFCRPSGQTTSSVTAWKIAVGPTPAGPFNVILTRSNITPEGWYNPIVMHRTVATNASTTQADLKIIYQGDFGGAQTYYHPTWSTLTLGTSPMAHTYVQGNASGSRTTASTIVLAYSSNVASGDIIACSWRYNAGAGDTISVSNVRDSLHGAVDWNIVYDGLDGGTSHIKGGWAWKRATASGACTVTITLSASAVGGTMVIGEWNGPTALRVASTKGTSASGVGTVQPGAITPSAGDLLISVCEVTNSVPSMTIGSSFNLRQRSVNAGNFDVGLADLLSASAGSIQPTWTNTGTPSGSSAGQAAFWLEAYSISGSAGVAGATVAYSGTASGSVVADGSGNYTIPSLVPGSYTLTPSKTGYTFSPTSSNQTVTNANISGVNFTATQVQVATPSISPNGGSFSSSQSVTLNDSDSGLAGFAMYYTTDGSTPTTGSTLYSSPFTVSSTSTVKVLAVATGYADSSIASANFTISTGPLAPPMDVSIATPTKINTTPLTAPQDLPFVVQSRRKGKDSTAIFQVVGTVTTLTSTLQVSLDGGTTWATVVSSGNFLSAAATVKSTLLIVGAMYKISPSVLTGSQDFWVCAN